MIRSFDLANQPAAMRIAHAAAERAVERAGTADDEIDVYLVDEDRMEELNRETRGHSESTNVLSFPYDATLPHPERGTGYRGEVYLCPAYIEAHGQDLAQMAIHGVLHLLGYDHETDADAAIMEQLEEEIHNRNT
jgi:probable rRNA maturation factor